MEWEQIRAHYARLFEARVAEGKRQEDIALAGGLSRQNQISRVLHNRRKGPVVETFVKAIIGLGLQPSDFFADLERHESRAIDLRIDDHARTNIIELKRPSSPALDPTRFAAAQAAFWEVMAGTKHARRKRPRRR